MNNEQHIDIVCADLFPTLIVKFPEIITHSEAESIYEKLKTKKSIPDATLVRGTSSYKKISRSREVFNDEDLLGQFGLKNKIKKCLDFYTDRIGIFPLEFANSWFAIQDIGGILKQHHHGGSVISGALFVNVDEKSSQIVFDNPNQSNMITFHMGIQKNLTQYTYSYYEFRPNIGDLILFPGYISHGSNYNPNQTKNRTIISFNTTHTYKHN